MTSPSSRNRVPIDALGPADVAGRLEEASIKRADLPIGSLIVLALLGGVYIGLGGALATLALTDSGLGFGPGKLVAGVAFSLGLVILVIAGGELFTGNNLMTLALASGKVSLRAVLRNWTVSYSSNAAGAMLLAIIIHQSGVLEMGNVKATAVGIAETKAQLGFGQAFLRGILCNMLVCLAVWLSVAARSVEGKIIAIIFPIGAFVALGFEHCVANLYLLPIGMLSGATVGLGEMVGNIVPVTLGNTVGGVGLAAAYWLVHLAEGTAHHRPLAKQHRMYGALRLHAALLQKLSQRHGVHGTGLLIARGFAAERPQRDRHARSKNKRAFAPNALLRRPPSPSRRAVKS